MIITLITKKFVDLTNNTAGFKDNTSGTGDDYQYDANGNMIRDNNKHIDLIKYNHLNLPIEIQFDNGKIYYTYDAAGTKLKKQVHEGSTITRTDYVSGYQYKDNVLQFFPTAEGYVNKEATGYKYVYNYTDHLGNVRLSYADNDGNGSIDTSEILEENNYYAFGLKHKGYNGVSIANEAYKYKYNGKELQDELGLDWYDLGARNLGSDIGRFYNADPLAEDYNFQSPYTFANNNPVALVDVNGMGVEEVIITGDASEKATKELNKSTSLEIKRDSNGKLSASGKAKTDADKKLLEVINSTTIKVELNATTNILLSNKQVLADGAYLGNKLSEDKKSVVATQAINPVALGKMSDFNKKPGADTLHEVIEAYVGGEIAIKEGVSGTPETNYLKVHNKASEIAPQSSPAYITKQNGVTKYWVGDGKSPKTTCIYNSYDPKKK